MSLFVFCFVQYLTILFGCTGVRWLEATCTDSSRQLHGFRQRDLATSRVAQLACYSLREVPRTPDVAPPVCYVLTQEEDRGRWWVSFRLLRLDTPCVARQCTAAAKDALALASWVGFRHCHVSYARGMCLFPLDPWPQPDSPWSARLFCRQGGSIVVGHTLWEQRLRSRMSDRR